MLMMFVCPRLSRGTQSLVGINQNIKCYIDSQYNTIIVGLGWENRLIQQLYRRVWLVSLQRFNTLRMDRIHSRMAYSSDRSKETRYIILLIDDDGDDDDDG
jgi:hypothetical protein